MFSTLISFLGGSAFRLIWGEISAYLTARQNHKHELEMLEVQSKLEAAKHEQQLESIRVQAELGVKTIQVQADADLARADADAFAKMVEAGTKPSGIKWVDAWNALIRPLLATEMMILITLYYYNLDWKLDDKGWELAGAVIGVFIADRALFKRGK